MESAVPLILSFVFGAVVGSFLNVVSLRFNTGSGLGGRSRCMSCGKVLSWKELIPILSFVFQRGACRKCKSRISWQYPLVEFAAGAIFAIVFLRFPPVSAAAAIRTLVYLVETCLLLVIAAYDMKHMIIPDKFAYTFDAVALASVFVGGASVLHAPHLWTLAAGPIVALPFALIWLVSRGRWMGLGDAKLLLGIGWLLGLVGAVNAVILAFWIGAAASLAWIVATGSRFKPRMEVPLAPYLILGTYLVLLFGVQVMDIRMLSGLF
ncbi:MAG: prepilin peptidase [Minisyncoccia bacterium]|jgi:prepilin signal peptidase PulO-like enzyme (type II secretory pathway)